MGRSLRDIWPLSLCHRKPISFTDVESGLRSNLGKTEIVLSPVAINSVFIFDELEPKNSDVYLNSHRSAHPTNRSSHHTNRTSESSKVQKPVNGNIPNLLGEEHAVRKDTPTAFCIDIFEPRPDCLQTIDIQNAQEDDQSALCTETVNSARSEQYVTQIQIFEDSQPVEMNAPLTEQIVEEIVKEVIDKVTEESLPAENEDISEVPANNTQRTEAFCFNS
ncbi:hypothetical protein M3Y97_00034000 [Aphelenchoides bicaudatus]|nr:hypothetical protein M3Y97_00034000 [Aphelenchoides bicaudatus]